MSKSNEIEMDFGSALKALNDRKKVSRKGWNGKGMWIKLFVPCELNAMTRPYLYHCAPKGSTNHYGETDNPYERVPWLPSQTDLFANDWIVVEGESIE